MYFLEADRENVFRFDSDDLALLESDGNTSRSRSFPTFANVGNGGSAGTRYMLIQESQPVQVCRLLHPRTVVGKLSSSKLLRRWETHSMVLGPDILSSATVSFYVCLLKKLCLKTWLAYIFVGPLIIDTNGICLEHS